MTEEKEEKGSNYNYGGEFKEGNTEGEKQWHTARKRLLEKFGFDAEMLDNSDEWEIVPSND